jgi:hypothetical protein
MAFVRLNPIAKDMTEVAVGPYTFLFSFKTCIAMLDPFHPKRVTHIVADATKYSKTTTKHLNLWLRSLDVDIAEVEFLPRGEFNDMLSNKVNFVS